jgi:hypothetical protein
MAVTREKYHQVRDPTMIDVRVRRIRGRMLHDAMPFFWIRRWARGHVLVHLFLQIDAHCAVGTDYFVSADARVSRNVAARIRNSHICGVVAHYMMRPLDRRFREPFKEQRLCG